MQMQMLGKSRSCQLCTPCEPVPLAPSLTLSFPDDAKAAARRYTWRMQNMHSRDPFCQHAHAVSTLCPWLQPDNMHAQPRALCADPWYICSQPARTVEAPSCHGRHPCALAHLCSLLCDDMSYLQVCTKQNSLACTRHCNAVHAALDQSTCNSSNGCKLHLDHSNRKKDSCKRPVQLQSAHTVLAMAHNLQAV